MALISYHIRERPAFPAVCYAGLLLLAVAVGLLAAEIIAESPI